jgi:hypothetical protein
MSQPPRHEAQSMIEDRRFIGTDAILEACIFPPQFFVGVFVSWWQSHDHRHEPARPMDRIQ